MFKHFSGPNDIVAIFFSGNGDGRGLKFPDRYLEVDELRDALSELRNRNGYRKVNNIIPKLIQTSIFLFFRFPPVAGWLVCSCAGYRGY